MNAPRDNKAVGGVIQAVFGYCWWGFVTALFYHYLKGPNVVDLVSWRVLSAIPVVVVVLYATGNLSQLREALTRWTNIRWHLLSSILILANWSVYIWAVVSDQLVDASLGYYLNPLVSIALGAFILKERLRSMQIAAVIVAVIGVVVFTTMVGSLPWISISLAITFPLYGLIRKQCPTSALAGMSVELLILCPLMLVLSATFLSRGDSVFQTANDLQVWLTPLSGVVTVVPLVCYAAAARKLRLSTVGMLQYIAPTGQLLSAVYLFGQEMNQWNWVVFICVWIAITMYSIDSLVKSRQTARRTA